MKLRDGFIIYDALYRWLKFRRDEKHLWFPNASKQAAASLKEAFRSL
jgi:hypothetical protein